jgi:hypothetical protein
MLNKSICKKCFRTFKKKFDHQEWKFGMFTCPHGAVTSKKKKDGFEKKLLDFMVIIHGTACTDQEPPKYCPFLLEHTVSNEDQ